MAKIVLRAWRFSYAEPSGSLVWFDPTRERVEIHPLERSPLPGVHEVLEGDDSDDIQLELHQVNNDPRAERVVEDLPF